MIVLTAGTYTRIHVFYISLLKAFQTQWKPTTEQDMKQMTEHLEEHKARIQSKNVSYKGIFCLYKQSPLPICNL